MFTQLLKERDSLPKPIFPQSLNGTSATTGPLDMSLFSRCQLIGSVGALGASGNTAAYLQESNEANGANATNVSGGAIVNIASSNGAFTIEVNATQLTKRYVQGVIGVSTTASLVCGFLVGTEGRYPPVNNNDNSTFVVQRIVTPNP